MIEVVVVAVIMIVVFWLRLKWEGEHEPNFDAVIDSVVRSMIEIEYSKRYSICDDRRDDRGMKDVTGEEWTQIVDNVMTEMNHQHWMCAQDRKTLTDYFEIESFRGVAEFINGGFEVDKLVPMSKPISRRRFNIVRRLAS
jgi:hypothetical protein